MSGKPSLILRRNLAAPPERVFAAWTEPDLIMRWWGPAGAEMLAAEVDLRVGGRFRKRMRTPDGEEHEVGGVFREIVPAERLVFTWAWHTTPERESLVTVELRPAGTGTRLTLTHEQFADETARDAHRGGWSGALDKLESFAA